MWDLEGREYIDYQSGFAAVFLGHYDPNVNDAVREAISNETILMVAGPKDLEGEFAKLFCNCKPAVDKIQITTIDCEASYHAIPIAFSATGRYHIIIMQGGYNGSHNNVAGDVISVESEDLISYFGCVLYSWGEIEHNKHKLPRICELITIRILVMYHLMDLTLN